MPRAKQAVKSTPADDEAAPSTLAADAAPPPAASTPEEAPTRQFRANPWPIQTVNLDGYTVKLQEARHEGQPWQMQIKFGDGSLEQRPSDAVVDFIKSHKVRIDTSDGPKEINRFRWNDQDRAWAMRIEFNEPGASREMAKDVFDQVVELVARERGVSRQR
jgi:hypothetical protein